ncbi:ABC transporter permease [Ideonella sp.]|uniref:ABC transporter permease n=1 Tax=Ideonella sp. TaxID=1929293 RepID=UPI0035AEE915
MFRRLATLVYNETMILLRDSTTLFWILIFPFFFLFMMLFSYGTEGKLPLQTIEIADLDRTPLSERFIALVGSTFNEKDAIPGKLSDVDPDSRLGKQAVRITVPEGFGYAVERKRPVDVKVTYAQDGMPAQFAVRVVRALTVRFNADVAEAPESVDVVVDDRDAAPSLSFTHYTLTGILVMSMMSAGMTTICIALAYRRERNGFKMMACMPISAGSFLSAMLLSRLLVLCVAAFALLFGGHYLFGIPLTFNAPRLLQSAVVIVLGGSMLLAMGTAMAARMATVASATLATNLVYIALLFLSDLTMPLTAMPTAVSEVMRQLPTAQFVTALRHVLVRGEGLGQQLGLLAAMLGWTLLFATIARVTFRWHRQAGG